MLPQKSASENEPDGGEDVGAFLIVQGLKGEVSEREQVSGSVKVSILPQIA